MLNEFYRLHANDSTSYFFSNYNYQAVFPEIDYDHSLVQGITSGRKKFKILADSSIVLLNDPDGGVGPANVLYAWDRNITPNVACN